VKPAILLIDDDPEMVSLLQSHLERDGWEVTAATSGLAIADVLAQKDFAVVLTDLVMPGVDGLALLREVQRIQPCARVVIMTAFGSLESAIEAMRRGAYDYLTKPFKLPELTIAVRRALDDKRLRDENRRLRDEVSRQHRPDRLLGVSKAMEAVRAQIGDVAGSEATVLLLGESGTGKELVARAIHWNSARRNGPFVAVNCAAIPETLLESELFGHEKGAFTGATQRRRGLFAEADGGTLFLDEIADMPLALQAKLLRVLQDRTVRLVGGREEIRVDIRVVSATNRDLASLLREGKFREDLYYRLAVIPIRIPSLRERPEDIPVLAKHFLDRAAAGLGKHFEGVSEEAMQWLIDHRWPGNVRELENVVERAATLARGSLIALADLRVELASRQAVDLGSRPTLAELERRYIHRVLEETGGDKQAAAKILGVSVRTLQRKEKEL
jgi:two-component system, NtrC family, response regulator HydG